MDYFSLISQRESSPELRSQPPGLPPTIDPLPGGGPHRPLRL